MDSSYITRPKNDGHGWWCLDGLGHQKVLAEENSQFWAQQRTSVIQVPWKAKGRRMASTIQDLPGLQSPSQWGQLSMFLFVLLSSQPPAPKWVNIETNAVLLYLCYPPHTPTTESAVENSTILCPFRPHVQTHTHTHSHSASLMLISHSHKCMHCFSNTYIETHSTILSYIHFHFLPPSLISSLDPSLWSRHNCTY